MKGVDYAAKYSPPEIRKKLFEDPVTKMKKSENKSPFSEEYLKIMEEINELKKNQISISSSNSDLKTLTPRSIASDRSTPRKGILKRSSSPNMKTLASTNNTQQQPLVHETRPGDISNNVCDNKPNLSVNPERSFSEKEFIIDVIPSCHNNSLISSGEEKDEEHGRNQSSSTSPDNQYRALRVEDLTIPYQLQNAKDSDTESSMSTTRDHIGRFEFLQDIQSHTKKHLFVHQKPESGEGENGTKREAEAKVNTVGLSARQQEYADKLIKKYTKSSTEGKQMVS